MKKNVKNALTKQLKAVETKNDKLLAKLFDGEKLTDQEEERWKIYNKIIDLRYAGYSRRRIAKIIQTTHQLANIEQAYPLIAEATRLFGEQTSTEDRQAEREFLADLYLDLYHDARNKGDYNLAKECLSEYRKTKKLDTDERQLIQPIMPVIVLSSDPQYAAGDHSVTVDTDFEHAGEETGEESRLLE